MSADPTQSTKLEITGNLGDVRWQTLRNLGRSRRSLRKFYQPASPNEAYYTNKAWPNYPPSDNYDIVSPALHPTGQFSGYAKGSRPPAALRFVKQFFIPDGFDADTALPLTEETYRDFLKWSYKQFINGKLLGAVEFDAPSKQDVMTILRSDPGVEFEMLNIPAPRTGVLKRKKAEAFGLSSSKFKQIPKQSSVYAEDSFLGTPASVV